MHNVLKFIKNRGLKQIASNKDHKTDNKKINKTAMSDFKNYGIFIRKIKNSLFLGIRFLNTFFK